MCYAAAARTKNRMCAKYKCLFAADRAYPRGREVNFFMAVAAKLAPVSPPRELPPPVVTEEEIDTLAFLVWQRGCCPDETAEEEWLTAEECLLIPH